MLVVGVVLVAGLLPAGASVAAGGGPAGARPAAASDAGAGDPGGGAGGSSEEDAALAQAETSGEPVEIVSRRRESSEVFATPDGALEVVEHLRPVRVRDGEGDWQPVDTDLAVGDGGRVAPKAAVTGMSFSGGGDGPLVRMERAGRELALSWPGALPEPVVAGDTATYGEVLPGVDLRLGAQVDGFTQLLVVKSAQAAASAELAELRLALAAEGMQVRESGTGGLEAVDAGAGSAVFEAPMPLMWDSSTGQETSGEAVAAPPAPGAAQPSSARDAADAAGVSALRVSPAAAATVSGEGERGPGESGNLAAVQVEVPTGGQEVVLRPDAEVLRGADTVYPVFIDPQWYAPRASAWTMASRYWASAPQWKFNGEPNAGLGYCGWAYCAPSDLKRLFYRIPTSRFAGKTVLSAEFTVRNVHSASCTAREVQLWRTKGINSSTTWNTQQASGFWIDRLATKSFAHGYEGCAAKDAEFGVKAAVQQAANNGWGSLTFGMRATSESDKYTWKRFSDKAHLRVKYNRPPPQVRARQLTMDPGGVCKGPDDPARVRSHPSVRADDVTDPDGDNVAVQFRASWAESDGWKARWTSARTTAKRSGSTFSVQLPGTVPHNKRIGWSVRAWDGAAWSPWSWQGSPTACYLEIDTSVPEGPAITSGDYPASDPDDPDDPWHDGVGKYGTFTLDSPSSDVTDYRWGINRDPDPGRDVATTGGAARTLDLLPHRAGVNFLTAQAFDAAGNGSEIRTYTFRVRPGEPERMVWDLDEDPGATTLTGRGEAWPAHLTGGARPGGDGVTGNGLELDGTDGHAATVTPVINTGKSFTVSAWAKIPTGHTGTTPQTIVAQAGRHTSTFTLAWDPQRHGWTFSRHTADTQNADQATAAQPACTDSDTTCITQRTGVWTHLVGVFHNPHSELELWIDGQRTATTPYTDQWNARGPTLLGTASPQADPASFFHGALDEVHFYDYWLDTPQIQQLYQQQPITSTTRPAKAIWTMEDAPEATTVTGHSQPMDLTLHGDPHLATPGVSGTALTLDGSDDRAVSDEQPVLDTHQSFAISLWARLPEDKQQRAMTAITQHDVEEKGFALYHSSALGGWVFLRSQSADPADGVVRATENACPTQDPHCPAAGLGQWTHVVGAYDQHAGKMSLYINGTLTGTTTFTGDWLATGPVTLGHARAADGSPVNHFDGQLDDIRLFDRTVTADEAHQLYRQRPRLATRWQFEEAVGTPPVTADAAPGGNDVTLHGNAGIGPGWVDFGGLQLDGVDDYAATGTVPVDTSKSFTVTAWAQAAATPNGNAALVSAAGSRHSAFTVRYVPQAAGQDGPGRFELAMPDQDAAGASVSRAPNGFFDDVRQWNHLALVYDGFAKRVQLYVNGLLEEIACLDEDGDGEPDDTSCTERISWAQNVLSFQATESLQIGRAKTDGAWGQYWPGALDDVWTFQGALSPSQVVFLADHWFGVPTEVPTG